MDSRESGIGARSYHLLRRHIWSFIISTRSNILRHVILLYTTVDRVQQI